MRSAPLPAGLAALGAVFGQADWRRCGRDAVAGRRGSPRPSRPSSARQLHDQRLDGLHRRAPRGSRRPLGPSARGGTRRSTRWCARSPRCRPIDRRAGLQVAHEPSAPRSAQGSWAHTTSASAGPGLGVQHRVERGQLERRRVRHANQVRGLGDVSGGSQPVAPGRSSTPAAARFRALRDIEPTRRWMPRASRPDSVTDRLHP